MRNLRNANAPPDSDLVQVYLRSSWDIVTAVYAQLAAIEAVADAIDAGDLAGFLSDTDIDTLAKLNAIVTDATFGDFATQAQAEAGIDNTSTMTPLRVAQAVAAGVGVQNNFTAVTNPGVGDDSDDGYVAGSVWMNVDPGNEESWRCTDPTVGAAVWIKTTLTSDELATVALTGDTDDLIEGVVQLMLTVTERATIAAIDQVYTSAEKTKLSNIEIAATADQTAGEIETAYQTQVPLISQAAAEAGVATDIESWSSERVAQAIAALAAVGDFLPLAGGQMAGAIEGDTGIELGTAAEPFWNVHSLNAYLTSFFYLGPVGNRMTITANEVSGGQDSPFDFSIDSKTADEATEYFDLQGQTAYANASTNIVGGEVRVRGGAGALNAAGDAHGGDLTLDGGIAKGTGTEGDVEICESYGKAKIHSELLLVEKAVGSLPAAATYSGYMSGVNDALAPVNGSTVAAGGAVACVVYSNGTNWIVVTGGTTASGGDVATDTIWDAAGDLAVGTGADTGAKLTMGSALQTLRVNAGATALEYAAPAAGGGGGLTVEFKTADFTAAAGKKYFIDSTTAPVEVTLPAGTDLDNIKFVDAGHAASSNFITFTPDGIETIDNDVEFIIDQSEGDIDIGYNDAASNWEVSLDGSPTLVSEPNLTKLRTVKTLIETIDNVTASSFDFIDIPAGYDRLIIRAHVRGDTAAYWDVLNMYINNDTTDANYLYQQTGATNATQSLTESATARMSVISAASAEADNYTTVTAVIERPDGSQRKDALITYGGRGYIATADSYIGAAHLSSDIVDPITRLTFTTDNDPTDEIFGSISIYGEKDEEIGGGGSVQGGITKTRTTQNVIEQIDNSTVAGNFDFTSIPSGYDRLIVKGTLRSDAAVELATVHAYINGDTTDANYHNQNNAGLNNTSSTTEGLVPRTTFATGASSAANYYSDVTITLENPDSTHAKAMVGTYMLEQIGNEILVGQTGCQSIVTAAVDQLTVQTANDPTSELFGVLTLYGEKNEAIGGGAIANEVPTKQRTVRTVIETITNTVAGDFDFASIPAGYDRLILKGSIRGDVAADSEGVNCHINNDTTATNYWCQVSGANNGTSQYWEANLPFLFTAPAATSPANSYSNMESIFEAPDSVNLKSGISHYGYHQAASNIHMHDNFMTSVITDPIDRLHIKSDNDPTDELLGELTLYGEKDEEIGGGVRTGFPAINAQTGTTYEFVETDLVNGVTANNASASTYDVPDDLGNTGGDTVTLFNLGAGAVTITVAGTDTLGSSDNVCEQGKGITVLKVAPTVWWVVGGSA